MDHWQYQPAGDMDLPPTERFKSLRRESGLVATAVQAAAWATTRVYLTLVHRLRIEGREHLPTEPPYILAANHSSHLDAAVMAMAVPWRHHDRLFPIAAGDVFFQTPARSLLAAMVLNALPMWRHNCGRHALEAMRQRLLDDACIYILFPEGTRSRDGDVQPFKAGVGMLLARSAAPVIPCWLDGTFEALPPGHRLPRPRSVILRLGRALNFNDVENRRRGWEQATAQLQHAIKVLATWSSGNGGISG